MAEFSIDDIISGFEGKSASKAKTGILDIDSLLSGFKTNEPVVQVAPKKIISTDPKPPISGISKESSDELNQTRVAKEGGKNPRRMLPTTNILEKINENYEAGKDLLGEAATDVQTGHPYKGLGKGGLGILSIVTSPASGLAEGGVGTPIADITGKPNPTLPTSIWNKNIGEIIEGRKEIQPAGIGDRAALVTGAAIPVAPGAGLVVKNLPKNKMFRQLVEDIGPENLSTVVQEMKSNPRLNPADLSPKVLQSTQELFAGGGPVNYLKKTSDARMGAAKDAIDMAYDTSAGVSVDLAKKVQSLAEAAKKVGNDQINPVLASAKPVNLENTLNSLDNILKPGALKIGDSEPLIDIKRQLEAINKKLRTSKEYDANDLHKFQSKLRERADDLEASINGSDKAMGKALREVRNNIVSDIDKSASGYKAALSAYRDEKNIADAFKEGYDGLFSSSKKMENTPSFVKKWFDGLSDAEKQAAKEGARASIATEIGVARNPALAGERLSRSDFNQEKLRILFGEAEANKLIKALSDERIIANTHNKIVEGSQTAMRDASKSQWKAPDPTQVGQGLLMGAGIETANILAHGYPGVGGAMLGTAKLGGYGKDVIKNKIHAEKQAQYAKYALPTEGPSRDELISALEAAIPKPKLSLMSRARLVLPTP